MSAEVTRLWRDPRSVRDRFVLLLAAGVVALVLGGVPWLGVWKMAIDWVAGAYVLIGPLSAGLVAWDMSRMRATRWDRVVCSTPRGLRGWLEPALMMWAIGVLADLALAAAVTVVTLSQGSVFAPRQLAILASGASVYLLDVAIGAYIGTRLPGPWAPPMAALLVLGLFVFSSSSGIPDLFRTGGVTGTLVGQAYDLGTLAVYCAFSLTAVVLVGWATLRHVSEWRPHVVLVVAALSALVATGLLVQRHPDRYVYVATPVTCFGAEPTVCMAAETRRPLEAVAAELHRLAEPLVQAGAILPTRWTQSIGGQEVPADSGVLLFINADEGASRADSQAVLVSLVTPARCPELGSANPPARALAVRPVLATWIAVHAGDEVPNPATKVGRWVNTGGATIWAVDTFEKLRTCRLGELRAPQL
jgi:hypothetical protein